MSKAINISESGLIKTGIGKLEGIITTATSSGTLVVLDGTEASVAASGKITSTGACAPASHATSEIASTGASVAATHAVSVLTGTENFVENETVTIGTTEYVFKDIPVAAYEVKVGENLETSLENLLKAINLSGRQGIEYGFGTVAHTQVVAAESDETTLTVRGRVPGTSLNTVATTEECDHASWADTTLGGGTGASDAGVTTAAATITIGTTVYTVVDELSENYGAAARAYQIKKGESEATMLDNLKLAVNGTGTAGTNYSTETVAHPSVAATTNADAAQTIVSRVVAGTTATTAINAIPTSTTLANTAFADTTLGGGTGNSNPGVTTAGATITIGSRVYTVVLELSETSGAAAVADQILWVTDEATFLDNLKKAINGSGAEGTDYSTGTKPNYQVVATTNSNTEQTIVAKVMGVSGNAIATTDTLANYAWGATALASGSGEDAEKILDTYTPSAGASIELNADFNRGLYITVGGTSISSTILIS